MAFSLFIQATHIPCTGAEPNRPIEVVSIKAKAAYNHGIDLEEDQNWRAALDAFLEAIAIQPKLAVAWTKLGRCYFELHDYKRAEQCYRYACEKLALPQEILKVGLQRLIRCEMNNGELEAIQQTRREYLAKFPNEADAKIVSDEIKFYDHDFVSTRSDEAAGGNQKPYRPWLPNGLPKMPVRVSVSASKLMSPTKSYTTAVANHYADLAKRAFLAWSFATDGKLAFDFVNNSESAQINCEWTNNLKERGQSFEGGHCETVNRDSYVSQKQRALVVLGREGASDDIGFYNICLHEIGHALGLEHSSHPEDVMYFSGSPTRYSQFAALSKGDIQRVRAVYVYSEQAAHAALEFGTAAFVNRDYEAAYEMLSDAVKKKESMEQFTQRLVRDGGPAPESLEIRELYGYHSGNNSIFSLVGRSQKNEKCYFIVDTEPMPDGTFRITRGIRDSY
jgi:tetratricopeptide (TPR) repeat protein